MTARITRIRQTLVEAKADLTLIEISIALDSMDLASTTATQYAAAHSLHSAIEAAQSRLAVMRDLAALEVEARGKAMDEAHQVSARLDTGAVFDQPRTWAEQFTA